MMFSARFYVRLIVCWFIAVVLGVCCQILVIALSSDREFDLQYLTRFTVRVAVEVAVVMLLAPWIVYLRATGKSPFQKTDAEDGDVQGRRNGKIEKRTSEGRQPRKRSQKRGLEEK
jgi:hypothetical protein